MKLEIKGNTPVDQPAEFFLQKDSDGDIEVYVQVGSKSFALGFFDTTDNKVRFNRYIFHCDKVEVSKYVSLEDDVLEVL